MPRSPEALLVAVDFSPCSVRALDRALNRSASEDDITLLHVVDIDLARRAEAAGLADYGIAIEKMRGAAEASLRRLIEEHPSPRFETMIVEGIPFVEIVRIANDLDCDLIVLGSHGSRVGLSEVLFGNTAERVLRTATRPVLCVP